jgi:hypothetical protein
MVFTYIVVKITNHIMLTFSDFKIKVKTRPELFRDWRVVNRVTLIYIVH